ncbi:MAG: adenylate kinase [Lachnospiraceae bacterium]|jgi:adenylate kinase family enzyme|nr:adenylate kinase [Lachnospiraceae bacterium]
MEKVLVIGCPGGGKSTFSRALNKITGIPLFYLDMIWHKPDKTTCSREVFDQRLGEILRGERWIIDGNYARTLPLRLADCDTVFWLDYPLETCIEGIRARKGKPRVDMPWIEMEEDEEFMEFVRNFPLSGRREIQRLLKEYPEKDIVVFYSREEAEAFLARQKKD